MNKFLPALALFIAPAVAFSQAQLVINGTTQVTIVENGGTAGTPIYLEIANPATTAIKTIGTLGWIVSESEFNMVKWDIGTAAGGIYTVPWGLGTTYNLPLSATLTGGSAAGSILFSTYHTGSDQAALAEDPTDVSLISGPNKLPAMNHPGNPSNNDDSYNVVDRFWIIDTYKGAFAYGVKPTASQIKFTYAHSGGSGEFLAPNQSIDEADLIAQRFNSTLPGWGDWLGAGPWAIAGNIGTVTNTTPVTPANFFRSWTLSNSLNPLPITLSSFTDQCDNGVALIQWTTQSELNNNFFTVEKTTDNVHFETVGTVAGAGTTSLPSNYSLVDNSPFAGQSYYILYQTDFDGNRTAAGEPIEFNGCGGEITPATTIKAYNTTNNIQVQINSVASDNFNISLIDMLGQTIFSGMHAVALGENNIILPNNISPGMYVLCVRNDKMNYTKKLVIGVR